MSVPILIAGDDPEWLDHVRRLVEREGADAVVAFDALEAMRQFTLREPMLTLLHVNPSAGLDTELCRSMKTAGPGRLRPVVVIAPRSARSAFFDAGCDAFLDFQSGDQLILRAVRRVLALHRPPRRLAAVNVSS